MAMLAMQCRKLCLPSTRILQSSLASQILTRHSSYESQKFPGYYVIYKLDSIKNVSIINRMKLQTTILSGVIISGGKLLEVSNLVTWEAVQTTFTIGLFASVLFHSIGLFCNNVIGYIYAKKNTNELKISYVNYWGKRVDIDINGDSLSVSDANMFMNSMFNNIHIDSPKKVLKLANRGEIVDPERYDVLIGV